MLLASHSMDRHLAYVGMTRHREQATLYVSRDEFAGMDALSARLSRSQAKETTLDYAQRRGIEVRSEIVVRAPAQEKAPERRRSMFDGLRLTPLAEAPKISRDLSLPAQEYAPPARTSVLEQAVDRYARAWESADTQRRQNLPVLEFQKQELSDAGKALDEVRPNAVRDLNNAMRYERGTLKAMMELRGKERAKELTAAIHHEDRVSRDPSLRVERMAKEWKGLKARHERLDGWQNAQARKQVEGRMTELARELKRDPQLESLMRPRSRELGIDMDSHLGRVM